MNFIYNMCFSTLICYTVAYIDNMYIKGIACTLLFIYAYNTIVSND